MYKLLIVEDDLIIAQGLQKHFEKYHYEVSCVENFENVLDDFIQYKPDLVLLDIHLPFFDGYYWCQEIRKISQVPIVFISSANENMNIVLAMNMGGDDFINKPFDLQVVQAKIQALLRRTYSFSKEFHLLSYQDVYLDLLQGKITYHQNELKILEFMFEHAEVIVSRVDLMNHLWDDHQFIDDNTLSVNMNRLRKKLEDIGLFNFIHTKKGLGYLLCLENI
jgi:two-component system response regulator protein BraR/BceR